MIDGLVELLIQLVHKISVRAEKKVENELSSEFRRVQGKYGILARLAQAALDLPEELVRKAIYPVVGTATLADIIAEAKANEKELRTRVRVKLRGSYSRHYRRGLPKLLRALDFHCNNTTFQPVMDALKLLDRYADSEAVFYDRAETVPIDHVVPEDWQEAVVDERGRIERIPYELCVLVALRKAIRRREIWVEGGTIWRNPEADLPADFDDNRDVHYEALKKPRDPAAFIADLQRRHTAALDRLETALRKGTTGGVKITRKKGRAVDQRPAAGQAGGAGGPEGAEGGDLPPVGCDRPAGRAQGRRPRHRLHRRLHLGGLADRHRPGGAAATAVALPVRAGDECRDQAGGRRRDP